MSVLRYPETINSKDVRVWDNAAFDNGESEDSAAIKLSWSSMKPSSINLSQSLELDSTKENHTPSMAESQVPIRSLASINPLQTNISITNTQQSIPVSKVGLLKKKESPADERNLDSEIEKIEKEISRLSSRLETLRLEKAKRNGKAMEKRGRIVAAKFMDPPKQSAKNSEEQSKIEESMCLSAKSKTPRRALSLGPAEITEICSATKLKQLGKEMSTPGQPSSRRKSCYWKLQDIDELRATKERGKSLSLSPKSQSKLASKSLVQKQAATTIGSKKTVKKEDSLVSSIQPKKLFVKDGEKSAPSKKSVKSARMVARRYSQTSNEGDSAMKEARKRSLPENEEDLKKSARKRASLNGKFQEEEQPATARDNKVKKQWEIPREVPKIKTRFENDSPRDSGPAKRVSELVGRKSYFSMDDGSGSVEEEGPVCQALDFIEEEVIQECLKIKVLRCVDENPRDSDAAKRVAQLVGRKSFFAADDDHEMPVFSFEEEDGEES